jgi:hypothetical protein
MAEKLGYVSAHGDMPSHPDRTRLAKDPASVSNSPIGMAGSSRAMTRWQHLQYGNMPLVLEVEFDGGFRR